MEVTNQNNSKDFTNHKNLKMHSLIIEIKMHGTTQGPIFLNALFIVSLLSPYRFRVTI